VADLGEVAAWAAQQPWSNGRVGTFGISYDGNTAELAAVPNQPAVQAVIPLHDDFDTQALLQPGGVSLRGFLQDWSTLVAAMDRNDVCALDGVRGWKCWWDRQVTSGVKPVDRDAQGKHLAELVRQRHNMNAAESMGKTEFRDDALVTSSGKVRFQDISPYGLRSQIESSGVPMMVWCGWMDANTCEGALIRYRTFTNPQVVVIGPLSHGGGYNADPFAASHNPPAPPQPEQYKIEADFFDRVLRSDAPEKIQSRVQYYTMGEALWHTTKTWPPNGFRTETFYLAEGNTLSTSAPALAEAHDSCRVDSTASSGTATRWHTQFGGGDVVYPDRATEDKKLLTYASSPLQSDVEITGSPVLTLVMASTAGDGAVHAYLEDVAPEGRVTYLDEGIFRVIHRKEQRCGLFIVTMAAPRSSNSPSRTVDHHPGLPTSGSYSQLTKSSSCCGFCCQADSAAHSADLSPEFWVQLVILLVSDR
jgi:putative CocE/NonD family hydrolase